jgi:hypothetical protein
MNASKVMMFVECVICIYTRGSVKGVNVVSK